LEKVQIRATKLVARVKKLKFNERLDTQLTLTTLTYRRDMLSFALELIMFRVGIRVRIRTRVRVMIRFTV